MSSFLMFFLNLFFVISCHSHLLRREIIDKNAMERGNRRHSSTFVESPKVKRRERQSGANLDDEMDSKPLIRQILLKDDPRVTPDQVKQFLLTKFKSKNTPLKFTTDI